MDYLARRDHSEVELRQKLGRSFPSNEVTDAIEFAKDNGWMAKPEDLAERVAVELGRRNKGHRLINQFLKNKGLPPVTKDLENEVEKAVAFIASKRRHSSTEETVAMNFEEQKKIYRWLSNRGFDDETIRSALAQVSKGSPSE